MSVLDTSIVNVAIPTMAGGLEGMIGLRILQAVLGGDPGDLPDDEAGHRCAEPLPTQPGLPGRIPARLSRRNRRR